MYSIFCIMKALTKGLVLNLQFTKFSYLRGQSGIRKRLRSLGIDFVSLMYPRLLKRFTNEGSDWNGLNGQALSPYF
jgi:hypothetical protein